MCSREFSGQKVVHHWPWLLSVDAERASRIVKNLCDISSTMNAWTSSYIPGFLRFGESFIMAMTLQTTSPRNMNNLSLTVFLSIKSNQTDFKHEKSLTVRKGVIRGRSPFEACVSLLFVGWVYVRVKILTWWTFHWARAKPFQFSSGGRVHLHKANIFLLCVQYICSLEVCSSET